MDTTSSLEEIVSTFPSLLVGFSGGVDSALLAVTGRRILGKARCLAVTGVSPSLSTTQRTQAEKLALAFDLNWETLETFEMTDGRYVANPENRCFYCKSELWTRLSELADKREFSVIADGTNADDTEGHRPGKDAGVLLGIRSPLAEAGFSKEMVRAEARKLGIPIWDAPASPCLSSRIQFGVEVTSERLRQVEVGEELLRSLGVSGDLRVRHRGEEARIEVSVSQLELVRQARNAISNRLMDLGFRRVTLDLNGYRSGSFLSEIPVNVEVLAESS
jgi:uncharacterized protein